MLTLIVLFSLFCSHFSLRVNFIKARVTHDNCAHNIAISVGQKFY